MYAKGEEEPQQYSQDDQHALVLPGVVRVIYHINGTYVVDPFSINVRTLEAAPRAGRAREESVDAHLSGTGFSISEHGLFATNAHVVTPEAGRAILVLQALIEEMFREYMATMMRYGPNSRQVRELEEALEAITEMDDSDPRLLQLQEKLISFARFVDKGSAVYVVPQGATSTSVRRLIESGHKVDRVLAPGSWMLNSRDVALLRIDDASSIKVPALSLASDILEGVNTLISAYGFPGSTDVSADSLTSVTVTQGRITSLKTTPGQGKFEMYQIDAKISSGSSGGPMVDQQGRVLGLITATTVLGEGDKFGFALPVMVLHDLLRDNSITELRTEYQQVLRNAYALKEERRCKRAIEHFEEAITMLGASAGVGTLPIQSHIDSCNELIAAGLSLDSRFDEFREWIRSVSPLTWTIIGAGFVLLIGASFMGLLLMRELTRSRAEVAQLEHDREILIDEGYGHPLASEVQAPNTYSAPPTTPPNVGVQTQAPTNTPEIGIYQDSPSMPTADLRQAPNVPTSVAPQAPTPQITQHAVSQRAGDGDEVVEQGDVVAVISHRPTYRPTPE